MRRSLIGLDTFSFTPAMNACRRCGEWAKVFAVFDDMTHSQVEKDRHPFNVAISACGSSGDWERALSLLAELRRSRLGESDAVRSVVYACNRAGMRTKAE